MDEGAILIDQDGEVVLSNPAATHLLGLPYEQLVGIEPRSPHWRTIRENGMPFEHEQRPSTITLTTGRPVRDVVIGVLVGDAPIRWLKLNCTPIFDAEGRTVTGAVMSMSDITALKRTESELTEKIRALQAAKIELELGRHELATINDQLRELAERDGLTGLKNRRALYERLEQECALAHRGGPDFSLLLIDVDHFKIFNDTYGHQVGDTVLTELANAFQQQARSSDFVARFGGEEFAILLPHTNQAGAAQCAGRLVQRVRALPFEFRRVTISVGCATYDGQGDTPTSIVERADRALYTVKRLGRDGWQSAA